MTKLEAAQIIRRILKDQRVRTTRDEVEALDMAATALVEATETPGTGIEGYGPDGVRRGFVRRQRPRLEGV